MSLIARQAVLHASVPGQLIIQYLTYITENSERSRKFDRGSMMRSKLSMIEAPDCDSPWPLANLQSYH